MHKVKDGKKICNGCLVNKELDCFYVIGRGVNTGKIYYSPKCKPCNLSSRDKEKQKVHRKTWKAANRDKVKLNDKLYAERHYGRMLCNKVKCKRARNATPVWADRKAMAEIYDACKKLRDETGLAYEVDHIIPLKSPIVCGLHIHQNLRIIKKAENMKKGNKLICS